MTVSPPDFDPDLLGFASIIKDGQCHALVSDYDDDGEYIRITECEIEISDSEVANSQARSEFIDEDVEWCAECWPRDVVES